MITVVLAAYAVTWSGLQQTPTYEASAQVMVGLQQEGPWQTLEYREPPPTQEIMHTIAIRSVAEETIQRLKLQMDPDELLDNLTVEQVGNTRFIVLTYESNDPVKATKVVSTVGQVSSELISQLIAETSPPDGQLTATVYEKAAVPESPVSPHPLRNGLLTLVIGLVLSAVLTLPQPRPLAARVPAVPRTDPREAEQELLEALGRRGKLTAVEASLGTSLSVEEANRMLFELAATGHLEITVEHSNLLYSFWGEDGA